MCSVDSGAGLEVATTLFIADVVIAVPNLECRHSTVYVKRYKRPSKFVHLVILLYARKSQNTLDSLVDNWNS